MTKQFEFATWFIIWKIQTILFYFEGKTVQKLEHHKQKQVRKLEKMVDAAISLAGTL